MAFSRRPFLLVTSWKTKRKFTHYRLPLFWINGVVEVFHRTFLSTILESVLYLYQNKYSRFRLSLLPLSSWFDSWEVVFDCFRKIDIFWTVTKSACYRRCCQRIYQCNQNAFEPGQYCTIIKIMKTAIDTFLIEAMIALCETLNWLDKR